MALDENNTQPGYVLGRLFAILGNIQTAALGQQLNAPIRDRYYGAASAAPASIFPMLLRNTQNHLSKLRKDKPGLAYSLEQKLNTVIGMLGSHFPHNLYIESQGQFAIGYYHQREANFTKHETATQEEKQNDSTE